MGWAKYYEDNLSIYDGRMATIQNRVVVYDIKINASPVIRQDVNREPLLRPTSFLNPLDRNERRGLELSFITKPEKSTARKLQINGWWWSNVKFCWCNTNTKVNRDFAIMLIMNDKQ